MSDERLSELAPLAALGALDGEDEAAFRRELARSAESRQELAAFEELVGRLARDTRPVPPAPELRGRVLSATRPAPWRRFAVPGLAAAAVLALAGGALVLREERDAARQLAAEALAQARAAREELARARRHLAQEQAFLSALVAHPDSRVASLAGLPAAPGARARVVWNAARGEAVLVASGLQPAPAGKVYEVWVIAQAAPVPAGVFQAKADGWALFRLPSVADLPRVKTFAVTIEPAGGSPAPTGPMVLAGAAS